MGCAEQESENCAVCVLGAVDRAGGCAAAEVTCPHALLIGQTTGIFQLNQVVVAAFGYLSGAQRMRFS